MNSDRAVEKTCTQVYFCLHGKVRNLGDPSSGQAGVQRPLGTGVRRSVTQTHFAATMKRVQGCTSGTGDDCAAFSGVAIPVGELRSSGDHLATDFRSLHMGHLKGKIASQACPGLVVLEAAKIWL